MIDSATLVANAYRAHLEVGILSSVISVEKETKEKRSREGEETDENYDFNGKIQ